MQRDVGSLARLSGESQTETEAPARFGALQHGRARVALRLRVVEAIRPDVELRRHVVAILARDGQGLGAALVEGDPQLRRPVGEGVVGVGCRFGGGPIPADSPPEVVDDGRQREAGLAFGGGSGGELVDNGAYHREPENEQ